MDALYLKNNVYSALTEALASMAVAMPDDKVEYLGKYLLKYVDRQKVKDESIVALQNIMLREENEIKTAELSQSSEAAARRKVQEDYTVKQKCEQDAFAEMNYVNSKNLSKIMSTIEELDIAVEVAEVELDEDGIPLISEVSPAASMALQEEPTEGDSDTMGEPEEKEDDGKNGFESTQKSLKVLTSLLQPGSEANQSLWSLQLWTKHNGNNFGTPMDDRVVNFFYYLGLFLGFESGYWADPQTNEPCWKIIRMRLIPDLISSITAYDPAKSMTIPYNLSLAATKESCSSYSLLETSSFPKCYPVMEILSMWFARALSAREQAIFHHKQKGTTIEVIKENGSDIDEEADDE